MSDWRENEDKNLTEHRIIGGAGIHILGGVMGGTTALLKSTLSTDVLGATVNALAQNADKIATLLSDLVASIDFSDVIGITMALMSPVFEIVSRLVGAVIDMLVPVIFGAVDSLLGAIGPMIGSLTKSL